MAWKMYYCKICGSWQSAKNGNVCLKCNYEMEMTDYVDEKFPPTEEFAAVNNLIFDKNKGIWECTKKEPDKGNILQNDNYFQRLEVETNRFYKEIKSISKDIRFMANVLRVYIIINIIAVFVGIFAWFIPIS